MTIAPSVDALNEARRRANRTRSEALIRVADGSLTPLGYIQQASTDAGRPLTRTTLYQLLLNQPDWGRGRAKEVLAKVADMNHVEANVRALTVGWALDHRTHNRRIQSLIDSLPSTVSSTPWPGFPLYQGPRYE